MKGCDVTSDSANPLSWLKLNKQTIAGRAAGTETPEVAPFLFFLFFFCNRIADVLFNRALSGASASLMRKHGQTLTGETRRRRLEQLKLWHYLKVNWKEQHVLFPLQEIVLCWFLESLCSQPPWVCSPSGRLFTCDFVAHLYFLKVCSWCD